VDRTKSGYSLRNHRSTQSPPFPVLVADFPPRSPFEHLRLVPKFGMKTALRRKTASTNGCAGFGIRGKADRCPDPARRSPPAHRPPQERRITRASSHGWGNLPRSAGAPPPSPPHADPGNGAGPLTSAIAGTAGISHRPGRPVARATHKPASVGVFFAPPVLADHVSKNASVACLGGPGSPGVRRPAPGKSPGLTRLAPCPERGHVPPQTAPGPPVPNGGYSKFSVRSHPRPPFPSASRRPPQTTPRPPALSRGQMVHEPRQGADLLRFPPVAPPPAGSQKESGSCAAAPYPAESRRCLSPSCPGPVRPQRWLPGNPRIPLPEE